MADESIPTGEPIGEYSEPTKQSIKDYFMQILSEQSRIVIKQITTAKNIYYFLIFWCVVSVIVSAVNVFTGNCDKPMREAGLYFKSRLFCEIE